MKLARSERGMTDVGAVATIFVVAVLFCFWCVLSASTRYSANPIPSPTAIYEIAAQAMTAPAQSASAGNPLAAPGHAAATHGASAYLSAHNFIQNGIVHFIFWAQRNSNHR